MIFERVDCSDRSEWLNERKKGLGGSDAAAIIGQNPWKTNEELWEEKTGLKEPQKIKNIAAVQYGIKAESSLRRLFKLDFPDYSVYHRENEILRNKKLPWLQASVDGELTDKDGRKGILEIKTTTINHSMQRERWHDKVPQNYYCQILHYLLVTGYDFAVLKAQLKSIWSNGEIRISTKHYFFERRNCENDLRYLLRAEFKFWHQVEHKERPALILPDI